MSDQLKTELALDAAGDLIIRGTGGWTTVEFRIPAKTLAFWADLSRKITEPADARFSHQEGEKK